MEGSSMKTLISHSLFLLLVAGCASGPGKSELNAEVKRLCAIDGGIKIYEAVTLPPEKFNLRKEINFYRPAQGESALGPEYLYKREIQHLLKGEYEQPAMWRTHEQVVRKLDGKLLGESVSYARRGGDIPGPWHPSSYICPELKDLNLLERVFVIRKMGDEK
jgi:hypothetical protein